MFIESGHFNFTDQQIDNKDRFVKIYILNRNFELISVIKKRHSFEDSNYLYDSFDGKIYNIDSRIKDNNFEYRLSEIQFN